MYPQFQQLQLGNALGAFQDSKSDGEDGSR